MEYIAFCITSTGYSVKVYTDGSDIQVVSKHGETWRSISGLPMRQAVERALERHCNIHKCPPINLIDYNVK